MTSVASHTDSVPGGWAPRRHRAPSARSAGASDAATSARSADLLDDICEVIVRLTCSYLVADFDIVVSAPRRCAASDERDAGAASSVHQALPANPIDRLLSTLNHPTAHCRT